MTGKNIVNLIPYLCCFRLPFPKQSKTTDFFLFGIEKYTFCLQKLQLKTKASFGGIMLWDVSWDQNNIIDGSRYSDHVFTLLKDTSIVRPDTKTPTQAPIQGSVEKERE